MAISTGSLVALAYIKETVAGTTPATPTLIQVPYKSESLEFNRDMFDDPSRIPDNMQRFMSPGIGQVSGGTSHAISHAQYDDLLAGAFMGTWATKVLKIGNTRQTFTIEELDPTISVTRVFRGCEIGSFALSVKPSEVASIDFTWLGRTMATGTATVATTTTPVQSAKTPFTTVAGYVKLNGAVAYVTSIDLKVDNGLAPVKVLGQNTMYGAAAGQKKVSGSMTVVFEDTTMYSAFLNSTAVAVEVQLSDGTNTQTWKMGTVKLSNGDVAPGDAGARVAKFDFSGLYDTATATILQITMS